MKDLSSNIYLCRHGGKWIHNHTSSNHLFQIKCFVLKNLSKCMFPELLLLYEVPLCTCMILTTTAYSSGPSVHLNTKIHHVMTMNINVYFCILLGQL